MNTIDEILSQSPHSTLYHSTGIGSLLGMVDSGVLWVSHIYYLNDSAEIVFTCRLLQNIVKERISHSSHQESEFLGQLHSWLITFTKTDYHLFVFSLTEEGNLLTTQLRSEGVLFRVYPRYEQTQRIQDIQVASLVRSHGGDAASFSTRTISVPSC